MFALLPAGPVSDTRSARATLNAAEIMGAGLLAMTFDSGATRALLGIRPNCGGPCQFGPHLRLQGPPERIWYGEEWATARTPMAAQSALQTPNRDRRLAGLRIPAEHPVLPRLALA